MIASIILAILWIVVAAVSFMAGFYICITILKGEVKKRGCDLKEILSREVDP